MLQVVVLWNLTRPDQEMVDSIKNIELRGYNSDTFLTGEFASKIRLKIELDAERRRRKINRLQYQRELKNLGAIKPLSVSDIADRYCPTRRDLYFTKGINRPRISGKTTWGRVAGNVVEKYLKDILNERISPNKYSNLISESKEFNKSFIKSNERIISQLQQIEKRKEATAGDTEWFLRLISNNGRAEFGLSLLHSILKEPQSLDVGKVLLHHKIHPNTTQIGINSPATPDFIIPHLGIVGDIKTGIEFKPYYQLTCAGYGLAYENEHGKGNDINWGIIYFFPTRNPSAFVRPLTFAQIYIFPIDDNLRRWFLFSRDQAYRIISKPQAPDFPKKDKRGQCHICKFREYCEKEGLELT